MNNTKEAINENYVIFDTDCGTDDAWALIILINAEKLGKCKILGITCVAGNTSLDNVINNVFRILKAMNRLDIPVFKGASDPMLPVNSSLKEKSFFMGEDGFGDLEHATVMDSTLLKPTHAVNAMYELVSKNPQKVSLILVGPLTNMALCINMYGADFLNKIKEVHIMGGNIAGIGNITKSAEFNFYFDPEAAHIVLEKCFCPITIIPWETCLKDNIAISADWRFNSLQTTENEAIKILNKAEEKIYRSRNIEFWKCCDGFVAAAFLYPKLIVEKKSIQDASVELTGNQTRGQMVLDQRETKSRQANVVIIEKVNEKMFKDLLLWVSGLLPSSIFSLQLNAENTVNFN